MVACADGVPLAATAFEPEGRLKGSVVIAPALGVPRAFYAAFARYLAENGYCATTFDYRGIGDSRSGNLKGRGISYADWGRLDLEAVLADAEKRSEGGPLFLVGHSTGGQIIGLAKESEKLSGIITAPSSLAHWRLYPPMRRVFLIFLWYMLIPLVNCFYDYFPARRLGISSVDAPGGAIGDWARWARDPMFLFSPRFGLDTALYARLSMPFLAYCFSDDHYVSRESAERLLSFYPKARVEFRYIDSRKLGAGAIGHFGFFKEKVRDTLWKDALAWMDGIGRR
jgi:predicted alpha/beta hydrolase